MLQDSSDLLHKSVVESFKNYQKTGRAKLELNIRNFEKLPEHQKTYLTVSYNERINMVKDALKANQLFLDAVAESSERMLDDSVTNGKSELRNTEHKHIYTILKQIYREWSVEGATERQSCFDRIVEAFCEVFDQESRLNSSVLVPGGGLGRLVCDLAETGCHCIHNEDDMNMIVASHGFMNNMFKVKSYVIYPWISDWCNNYGGERALRAVVVPDVHVRRDAKMVAFGGDFYEIFDEEYYSTFDCVVTCFFIDTAKNVISCIEKIHLLLKPKGIWINLGPLAYHYTDNTACNSIEPTFEELKHIIFDCLGFEQLRPIEFIDCPYFNNPYSMHRFYYNCPLFVVRK